VGLYTEHHTLTTNVTQKKNSYSFHPKKTSHSGIGCLDPSATDLYFGTEGVLLKTYSSTHASEAGELEAKGTSHNN